MKAVWTFRSICRLMLLAGLLVGMDGVHRWNEQVCPRPIRRDDLGYHL